MSDATPPFGPGNPDFMRELARMLEKLGISPDSIDLNQMMQGVAFGFTNADADPDASWRTTITAAIHELGDHWADPKPLDHQVRSIADVGRLVDTWLNPHMSFPSLGKVAQAWTKEHWLQASSPVWRKIVDPIVTGSADALRQAPDVPELADLAKSFRPMLRQAAMMMYRTKLRHDLAKLASQQLSGTELGLPLIEDHSVVLFPATIEKFSEGLDITHDDLLLYLACRETARQRLFAAVGWLGPSLQALVEHYAREIRIDMDAIASSIDITDMDGLSLDKIGEIGSSVAGSFFEPASTPTQLEILSRLETLVALVEGWVDEVTHAATSVWMPSSLALLEVIRRRRAAGGPGQAVLASLIGLELRPRRVRDAANLWAALLNAKGVAGRDEAWGHPDLIPSSADLDDPLRYVSGENNEDQWGDLDDALKKLLEEDGPDAI